MILGGVVAALGVQNPNRRVEAVPSRGTAQAGECGHSVDCDEPKVTSPGADRALGSRA
jgi:hypothetical protein